MHVSVYLSIISYFHFRQSLPETACQALNLTQLATENTQVLVS